MTSYPLTNDVAGNPRYGQHYYDESVTGGVFHVYQDGARIFVSNSGPDVVSTGGVPGVPTYTPPPPPPPPPAAAPPPPPPPPPPPAAAPPPPTPTNTGGTPAIENTQVGNPRYGEYYTVEPANGGVWHVYSPTDKVFVAAGGPDVESTGGVPGVPTAPGFSNTPSSAPPTVVSQSPQPITGGGSSSSEPTFGQTGGAAAPGATITPTAAPAAPASGPHNNPDLPDVVSTGGVPGVPSIGVHNNPNLPDVVTTGGVSPSGASYTVVSGDTLSGIAAAHGISLSELESLNPEIKNPDLIYPHQVIHLGGASTDTPSVVSQSPQPITGGGSSDPGHTTFGQTGGNSSTPTPPSSHEPAHISGGIGGDVQNIVSAPASVDFPSKSSYPFTGVGAEAEKAGGSLEVDKNQGWGDGNIGASTDVVKGVFEVDSHTNTDPLNIKDGKPKEGQ